MLDNDLLMYACSFHTTGQAYFTVCNHYYSLTLSTTVAYGLCSNSTRTFRECPVNLVVAGGRAAASGASRSVDVVGAQWTVDGVEVDASTGRDAALGHVPLPLLLRTRRISENVLNLEKPAHSVTQNADNITIIVTIASSVTAELSIANR